MLRSIQVEIAARSKPTAAMACFFEVAIGTRVVPALRLLSGRARAALGLGVGSGLDR
jgi:hypothetical protein